MLIKNKWASIIFYLSLSLILLCLPAKASAAETKIEGIIYLEADKTYYYDLNGDGKEDKIYYKSTYQGKTDTSTLELFINDQLCLTRKDNFDNGHILQICDLDSKDNYLDFYLYVIEPSDGVGNPTFFQYDGKSILNQINFKPNELSKHLSFYRFSIDTVKGDKTFTILADTPIYSASIGCYLCYITYKLENNKITMVASKTYSFSEYSTEYKYKSKKSFSAYKTAGSKVIQFKVKKGDVVTFDKLHVTNSGTAYVRIVNKKGKKAWINANQEELFYELPLWG